MGVGVGVGVGVGGTVETVMLSCDEKKNPVESQARMMTVWFPAAKESAAVREGPELWACFTESTYMIMAVTGCSLSRAAAENVTGDLTDAPLEGAQIFTVLSTVAVQAWAEERVGQNKLEMSNSVPAVMARIEITKNTLNADEEYVRALPNQLAQF